MPMRCPDCGYEKKMTINDLRNQGFGCVRCSDGKPYPEKFMFNIFDQLNINFLPQLNKTTFKWCDKYKYDNYILGINCIIETHGLQHYEETKGTWYGSLLKDIQENDKSKEQLAKNNNIDYYVILDCRNSTMEWIKKSIMKSELPRLLSFKEEDIDWLKAHEAGCKSLVKIACDMWKCGLQNVIKIASLIRVDKSTIRKYLYQGVEAGLCDYNGKEETKKNYISTSKKFSVKVICLTTNEVFNSMVEASKKYNIKKCGISACCSPTNIQKSAGKLLDGTKLVWQHYSEYLKLQELKTSTLEELSINDDSFSIAVK